MSKSKTGSKPSKATKDAATVTDQLRVDPVLASLFATSSGPITAPVKKTRILAAASPSDHDIKDSTSDSDLEEGGDSDAISDDGDIEGDLDAGEAEQRPRKRRRLSQEDDLESSYLTKLAREEQKEDIKLSKKRRREHEATNGEHGDGDDDDADTASSASNDLEDLSDLEPDHLIPQHESLAKPAGDQDKVRRTVFLGNVSTEAIKSKSSRKQLESHLKSVLDDTKESIESIRFRSTAFNVTAGPKRAAYAKKELMDDTTKSTNAYVVLTAESGARKIAKQLNGTIVLDRHLHTDWLAHPTATDHKRCIFVGNLNFVDLESSDPNTNTDPSDTSKPPRRSKARTPADAEEGLWRAFGKCGTIESVRVIRDKITRIGKGFAYVQFTDEVATEKALALDGKRFPPMLPRTLRVSRAKRVLKKDLKRKRDDNDNNLRQRKGLNNATGPRRNAHSNGNGPPRKKLDGVVFEGYRASSDKGMKFKSKTKGKKKSGIKPATRSSKRGAAFRASGGKKKRDT